jgi:hypothetical protein
MRHKLQIAILYASSLLLLIAFARRLYTRGGPYFERPVTIVDHVGPNKHDTRDALAALPQIAPLLPRGALVTCFKPIDGQEQYDAQNFLTAVGLLPDQFVQPPFTAGLIVPRDQLVEYVIAIDKPFTHPAYKPVAGFPHATLYQVQR